MVILEKDLKKIIREEAASFLASIDAREFKSILLSIKDEISSGMADLDLDLDLIYNALIGSEEDTFTTQLGQSIGGRGMRAKKNTDDNKGAE